MSDILKQIQAIIFLSGKNVNIEELASFFEVTGEQILEYLKELQILISDTGINLVIKENNVFMSSNPLLGEVINKYFNPEIKIKKLSKSSMETLTIIAYKGPVTKSEIEEIKGVSVDNSILTLVEKKLIHSVGRKKALGSPKLYEVTNEFYGYLGLENKEELYLLDKAQWLQSLDYTGEEKENEN